MELRTSVNQLHQVDLHSLRTGFSVYTSTKKCKVDILTPCILFITSRSKRGTIKGIVPVVWFSFVKPKFPNCFGKEINSYLAR